MHQTLEEVLKELHVKLWDQQRNISQQQKSCLAFLAVSHQEKPMCPCPPLPVGSGSCARTALPALPRLSAAFFQMLAADDVVENKVGPLYKALRLLRSPRMEMVSLVLTALLTLSERAETVSRLLSGADMWHLDSEASGKVVACPGLRVRFWGDCSKRPACHGMAWRLPGELTRHRHSHGMEIVFCTGKKNEGPPVRVA